MSHIRQVCAPPTAAPATPLNSSGTHSPAIGSIYKILNTSGLEGKNILQLIPVPTSSIKSNAVKATVASPHHLSFQTHLSNCTAMPMIHVPFLRQVNTGQNIVTSKPDPSGLAHRVAAEVYAASLRDKSVSIDKPLLPKSAMVTPNQANKPGTVVKTNRYPVTVKSPVLPSGHHLQIPADAEVKSVPASSLPLSIQQKILTAAAASASGTQGSNMPSVIFVSPVNTVKTDCSKRLPPLYPKPHVSNSAPVTFAKSQESRNASSCSKVAEETPMKWIVHDSPQSESQCLVPVKSSNNMASKILKTLADNKTDNNTANIISLCSNSTSDTKTKIAPIKDNALVMYNGKVYLLAKKGMNAMIGESENSNSPSVKMVDKPSCDITNPGTLNTLSNQVVDMVLSKNKNISLSDGGKPCINPGIVLQTKAHETNISHPITPHVNQENQPRIVSTIRINTNGKCTIKSDYSANHENANVAIQEEDTVKTHSVQTDTNDLLKSEQEVAVSPEPPCNLTSDNLGKRIGLLKEIKVNLKRIPSDVIECCSRKTEQRLTSGVATGKEDTGTAFERKVHEIRKEISIAFEPESCKPPISELCNNLGSKQMNKSEEPAQKEVKNTVMVQPVVHQNASTEVSVEKDVKAASINQLITETFRSNDSNKKTKTEDNVENGNLTKEECSPVKDKEIDCAQNLLLSQTPLLNPNIFEQISSDLKLTIMKENKSQLIDNLQKMSEECTLASSVEHASTSLPNANIILSLNSNVLKQQAEMDAKKRKTNILQQQAEMGAKKRKPMDKTGTKRTKHIKGNMLNNIVPANDRLQAVNQQLQRSQVSQQEAKLKSKVLKKRKIKLDDISTKRNKNEACILTSDSEAIISSNLVLSESNSPSSEVCNVATELKTNHANKRKQKLVPMQTPNLMETEKECLINQDLTADSLFESSSCHSELLQMQPDLTERNQSKELCILTKHPETSNTETDRHEKICASSKDLETAKPDKRRIEEETPNRERDRKEVCMLNKKQMISTNKKQTDFVCPVSKDPVIASADTNGNEVICSISKDPETNNSKSNKTEVDYSVSKGSESTNTETRKNIEVCAISKNSETTNTCPTLPNQGASQSSRGHSQLASELKRKHQEEETHTDNIQNTETIQINECSVFKEGTAGNSKAPTWHQPLTSILQGQAVASPIAPTTIGTTSPGPSSETLQGTSAFSGNHVQCESFPLPPLEVDETMIEERREERIRRLKDRLKEQERALEAIRKTMRPIQ